MNFITANGSFALIAPLLTVINADIGPDESIVWVPLAYLLTLTVFLVLVGRLTDIFGRR
jgi:MFS family permease